ncbi:guanosine-5'-triphosphate,3'-diphosphate diphosphatase [Enterovibrio nigricans]|uniref:Guanosine-5'-triphosphate,3'-diphosphate pyrophosphatase n=1 Tax=Enterovibrio nigricans DSM 22720 TaxID=1121868 RepID=A0A1T4V163_9GAMM|nr:guanosine-5'-triphosphate,3'-diphosphate diphosphatase [Enterovibrio nigricans]SKA58672.1 exopolyphosphatase / guanosine-5'-triphosphate,3'-diphosphate pyrophosphatase [Enterovibrio nigricans DSM 22720]
MDNARSPLFAAIDLGSNSFHMLVVREVQGSVQTLAKIKRKVRLASGLDDNLMLSHDAMQRGWDCLSLFAERLQDIPSSNIRIVATAALRSAKNADVFIANANQILGHPITVITGEQEACTIYQGVAHTSGGKGKRLVVDIGGASTEIIIGKGFDAAALTSLDMGCVTWLEKHFKDRSLTDASFQRAVNGAKAVLAPMIKQYRELGWEMCVGASGTVQALQEIMVTQGMDETITLAKLHRLRKQAIGFGQVEELDIDGLTLERALVFPSGLSILIAIFEELGIESMTLAGGALREGLVYGMMDTMQQQDIRQRTILSIQSRFQLDTTHADNVAQTALSLLAQCGDGWVKEPVAPTLLAAAAAFHEIGITLGFKRDGEHAAYLLNHLDLPGFTLAQKQLLAEMVRHYREQLVPISGQNALSSTSANRLLRLLRLSVILCHRREKEAIPTFQLDAKDDVLTLNLEKGWLEGNALMTNELTLEEQRQSDNYWPLTIQA